MLQDTRLNLNNDRFEQISSDQLNLSGTTDVYGNLKLEVGSSALICDSISYIYDSNNYILSEFLNTLDSNKFTFTPTVTGNSQINSELGFNLCVENWYFNKYPIIGDGTNNGVYETIATQEWIDGNINIAYHTTIGLNGLDDVNLSGLTVGNLIEYDGTNFINVAKGGINLSSFNDDLTYYCQDIDINKTAITQYSYTYSELGLTQPLTSVPNLQSVTDVGNNITNTIQINGIDNLKNDADYLEIYNNAGKGVISRFNRFSGGFGTIALYGCPIQFEIGNVIVTDGSFETTLGNIIEQGSRVWSSNNKFIAGDYLSWSGETLNSLNTNNYVTSVSGSGNGILTLTREGLVDITADLSHDHGDGQYTDTYLTGFTGNGNTILTATLNNNVDVSVDLNHGHTHFTLINGENPHGIGLSDLSNYSTPINEYIQFTIDGLNSAGFRWDRLGVMDAKIELDANQDLILNYQASNGTGQNLRIVRGSTPTDVLVADDSGGVNILNTLCENSSRVWSDNYQFTAGNNLNWNTTTTPYTLDITGVLTSIPNLQCVTDVGNDTNNRIYIDDSNGLNNNVIGLDLLYDTANNYGAIRSINASANTYQELRLYGSPIELREGNVIIRDGNLTVSGASTSTFVNDVTVCGNSVNDHITSSNIHIDWTIDQGAININSGNILKTAVTQYSYTYSDLGLTQPLTTVPNLQCVTDVQNCTSNRLQITGVNNTPTSGSAVEIGFDTATNTGIITSIVRGIGYQNMAICGNPITLENGNVEVTNGKLCFPQSTLHHIVTDGTLRLDGDVNGSGVGDIELYTSGGTLGLHVDNAQNVNIPNGNTTISNGNLQSSGNMEITGAGWGIFPNRVGIGTVPNLTGDKLQVLGSIGFSESIKTMDINGNVSNVWYTSGTEDINIIRNYSNVATLWTARSQAGNPVLDDREATLALVRTDDVGNEEFLDLYNNGYHSVNEVNYGIRIQKRGTGAYRPFKFEFSDGTTVTEALNINTDFSVNVPTGTLSEQGNRVWSAINKFTAGNNLSWNGTTLDVTGVLTTTPTLEEVTGAGNHTSDKIKITGSAGANFSGLGLELSYNTSTSGSSINSYDRNTPQALPLNFTASEYNFGSGNVNIDCNLIIGTTTHNYPITAHIDTNKNFAIRASSTRSTATRIYNINDDSTAYIPLEIQASDIYLEKGNVDVVDGTLSEQGVRVATQNWVSLNYATSTDLSSHANTTNAHGVTLDNLADYQQTGNQVNLISSGSGQKLLRFSHPTAPTAAGMEIGFNADNSQLVFDIEYSDVLTTAIQIDRSTKNVDIPNGVLQEQGQRVYSPNNKPSLSALGANLQNVTTQGNSTDQVVQLTGENNTPTTDVGMELEYMAGDNKGRILVYDRGGTSGYQGLELRANPINLSVGNVNITDGDLQINSDKTTNLHLFKLYRQSTTGDNWRITNLLDAGGQGSIYTYNETLTSTVAKIDFETNGDITIPTGNLSVDGTGTSTFAGDVNMSSNLYLENSDSLPAQYFNDKSTGDYSGLIRFQKNSINVSALVSYDDGTLVFRSGGGDLADESLRITDTGKLLVGLASSTYKFDVSGTGHFSSNLDITGNITAGGEITASNFILSSDIRLKENIKPIVNNYTDEVEIKQFNFKDKDKEGLRYGVIAQELQEKHPEMVNKNDEGYLNVAYFDFLLAKVARLEQRVKQLEDK